MEDFLNMFFKHRTFRDGMMSRDEEDDYENKDIYPEKFNQSGFQIFDGFRQVEDMMNEMENVFHHIHVDFDPSASGDGYRIDASPHSPRPSGNTLRDQMLNAPVRDPPNLMPPRMPSMFGDGQSTYYTEQADRDIDGSVNSEMLSKLFKDGGEQGMANFRPTRPHHQPKFQTFGSSSVYSFSRGADGVVEEQRTNWSSGGGQTTTVTRSVDGKKYTTVTKRDRDGRVETTESVDHTGDNGSQLMRKSPNKPFQQTPFSFFPRFSEPRWNEGFVGQQQDTIPEQNDTPTNDNKKIWQRFFGDYFKK